MKGSNTFNSVGLSLEEDVGRTQRATALVVVNRRRLQPAELGEELEDVGIGDAGVEIRNEEFGRTGIHRDASATLTAVAVTPTVETSTLLPSERRTFPVVASEASSLLTSDASTLLTSERASPFAGNDAATATNSTAASTAAGLLDDVIQGHVEIVGHFGRLKRFKLKAPKNQKTSEMIKEMGGNNKLITQKLSSNFSMSYNNSRRQNKKVAKRVNQFNRNLK